MRSKHPFVDAFVFAAILFGTAFSVGSAAFGAIEKRKAEEDATRHKIRENPRAYGLA